VDQDISNSDQRQVPGVDRQRASTAPIGSTAAHARAAVNGARARTKAARLAERIVVNEAIQVCAWNGMTWKEIGRTVLVSRWTIRDELRTSYRWSAPIGGGERDLVAESIAAAWGRRADARP
jgi:hypothetical protein